MKKYLNIIVLSFCIPFNLIGQSNNLTISKLNYLENFDREQIHFEQNLSTQINHLWAIKESNIPKTQTDFLEAQKDFTTTPLSFEASGRYSYRNSNIIDQNDVFQSNIRVGLKYQLLGNNGWYNNKLYRKKIDTEIAIHQILKEEDQLELLYSNNYQNIIYNFNSLLLEETNKYIQSLNKQLLIAEELYSQKLITYRKVLEVLKKISRLKLYNKQLTSFNENCNQCKVVEKPTQVFDIDIKPLLNQLSYNKLLDSIYNEKIHLEYRIKKLPKLHVYTQHLIAFRDQNLNNQVPSVGFSFSMPLFNKSSKKIEEIENLLYSEKNELLIQNLKKEIMVLYYEFQEKSKQYNEVQQISLIENENLNTALIKTDYKQMSYELYSFQKINTLWDLKIESLDILRQQNLLALSIFTKAGLENYQTAKEFIIPIDYQTAKKDIAVQWDVENNNLPIHLIIHFLQRKNINKLYIKGENNKLVASFKEQSKHLKIDFINSLENYSPTHPSKIKSVNTKKVFINNLEAWIESIIDTL